MDHDATMHTGPLGSTIHVLRADAATVTALAAIDWNRWFPRVCLDPVRGFVTLMTPSRLHENLAEILLHVVGHRGVGRDRRVEGTAPPPVSGGRQSRPARGWSRTAPSTSASAARGYQAALLEGEAAADAFLERTAPDLVVEVEITSAGRRQDWALRRAGWCASCGGCMAERGPAICGSTSSRFEPERIRARFPLRTSSAVSPPTTSARRWTACGSA